MLVLSDDVENTDIPIVNCVLIFVNLIAFGALCIGPQTQLIFNTWGTIPIRFFAHPELGQFQFMVSSMFLHGGLLHLIGNMWALHLFGDNVEDRLGHFTYLMFYLVCGIFADIIYVFSDPFSSLPAIGASGAIAGVMGAYVVLHPEATCKTWWGGDTLWLAFRTYNVPASIIIFAWFALQVFCTQLHSGDSDVAFFAHIGGFLAGIALLCFVKYRAYKSENTNTVSYGGALPGICLVGLMGLVWFLINPMWKHEAATAKTPAQPAIQIKAKQNNELNSEPSTIAAKSVQKTHAHVAVPHRHAGSAGHNQVHPHTTATTHKSHKVEQPH